MGDVKGFLKYLREDLAKETVSVRKQHWKEFIRLPSDPSLSQQGARCMDCGVPFCHWGCPLANLMPEWNDLVFRGRWKEAYERLSLTNSFSEITGRLCPAPCENSCVLAINQPAVSIRNLELAIVEKAYQEGWIVARLPLNRTGKKIAVVGSGPSGLACADQLNKLGHFVEVFEKNEVIGGLLSLGIPDFKLEKWVVERRVALMQKEGIVFHTGINVGQDVDLGELQRQYDAIVLCGGAEQPRGLSVPGADLQGVHQAIHYLMQQNRVNAGQRIDAKTRIMAYGKNVVVLGGGDTGSDCVGTANRQGAKSVKQFEILPRPPEVRAEDNPWPQWAFVYRKSSSQEEGVEQDYCVMTKRLSGHQGKLQKLHAVRLEYGPKDPATGRRPMQEVPGSEFEVACDFLILALGFLGPVKKGLLEEIPIALDERGNVKVDANYMTSVPGVFAAGDMHRGQSLVVWALDEGRKAAHGVNQWLLSVKGEFQGRVKTERI